MKQIVELECEGRKIKRLRISVMTELPAHIR